MTGAKLQRRRTAWPTSKREYIYKLEKDRRANESPPQPAQATEANLLMKKTAESGGDGGGSAGGGDGAGAAAGASDGDGYDAATAVAVSPFL